jgi:sigma54-dependent transcription regulator
MNGEAKELRQMAEDIERVAVASRAYSMVAGQVTQMCNYITLRALVIELTDQRDKLSQSVTKRRDA